MNICEGFKKHKAFFFLLLEGVELFRLKDSSLLKFYDLIFLYALLLRFVNHTC